jgi:hypothetical protein
VVINVIDWVGDVSVFERVPNVVVGFVETVRTDVESQVQASGKVPTASRHLNGVSSPHTSVISLVVESDVRKDGLKTAIETGGSVEHEVTKGISVTGTLYAEAEQKKKKKKRFSCRAKKSGKINTKYPKPMVALGPPCQAGL